MSTPARNSNTAQTNAMAPGQSPYIQQLLKRLNTLEKTVEQHGAAIKKLQSQLKGGPSASAS